MPFNIDFSKLKSDLVEREIPDSRCAKCVHYRTDNPTYPKGYCSKIQIAFHAHDPVYHGIYDDCQKYGGSYTPVRR